MKEEVEATEEGDAAKEDALSMAAFHSLNCSGLENTKLTALLYKRGKDKRVNYNVSMERERTASVEKVTRRIVGKSSQVSKRTVHAFTGQKSNSSDFYNEIRGKKENKQEENNGTFSFVYIAR